MIENGSKKTIKTPNILLFGYGNPGRQDDGLGVELINQIEPWIKEKGLQGIELDSNYQLNIEDASTIAEKDIVLFIDASVEDIEDVWLTTVNPSGATIEFTMHAVSASFVLDLCHKLYKKYPETYMLHIKGYEWEFKEGLTGQAWNNLNIALDLIRKIVLDPELIKNFVC